MTMRDVGVIEVAVAVARNAQGQVLLAERSARQISAGFWELPGGKIDPGETAAQAAARELHEEVGLEAEALSPWIVYEHAYSTRRVRLHFFRIERWRGQPHGREGQRWVWADPDAPPRPLLPSNARALALLALPATIAVTDSHEAGGPAAMLECLAAALHQGVRLIQLREPRLAPDQRVALAGRVARLAQAFGARVLFNGPVLQAQRCGAAGVHTPAAELRRLRTRPPVRLWSASCHDAADLARAAALGADFAIVSPVLATPQHPGVPPLGFDGVRRLATTVPIAVYAQGGMQPASVAQAQAAGAAGVVVSVRAWQRCASVETSGRSGAVAP